MNRPVLPTGPGGHGRGRAGESHRLPSRDFADILTVIRMHALKHVTGPDRLPPAGRPLVASSRAVVPARVPTQLLAIAGAAEPRMRTTPIPPSWRRGDGDDGVIRANWVFRDLAPGPLPRFRARFCPSLLKLQPKSESAPREIDPRLEK